MPNRNPAYSPNPAYYAQAEQAYSAVYYTVAHILQANADTYAGQKRHTLTICRAAWNTYIASTEHAYSGAYPASIASAAWLGCLHARKDFHNQTNA